MHFDRSDLQQLTPEYVRDLSSQRKDTLVEQLRKDLMNAQDRLNQNSSNSSRPPSSQFPWNRPNNSDNDESIQEDDPAEMPEELKENGQPIGNDTSVEDLPKPTNEKKEKPVKGKKKNQENSAEHRDLGEPKN